MSDCKDHADVECLQIFVSIGDKSWGVMACQQYFGGIEGSKSLHVGDQFLSAGANDFKVSQLLLIRSRLVTVSCASANNLVCTGEARVHHSLDRQPLGNCTIA